MTRVLDSLIVIVLAFAASVLLGLVWCSDARGDDGLVVYLDRADVAAALPAFEASGVVPMVRTQWHYGHGFRAAGATFETHRPESMIAADLIAAWEALPEGAPVGMFLHGVGQAYGPEGRNVQPMLHPAGRSPEALARGGFVEYTQGQVRRVMQRLHLAGVDPDLVILDYETGWRRGALGQRGGEVNPVAYREDVEAVWALAADTMPAALRAAGAESMLPRASVPATAAYHAWSLRRRDVALSAAVYEPVSAAFGRPVAVSNYLDQVRAWTTTDLNGWTQPVVERLEASWSAPVAYLADVRGSRYRELTPEAATARVWADQRDDVRAALAWSPDVSPWYSRPDYGRPEGVDVDAWRWAWAAGLLHDRTLGVRRMLFFSAGGWSEDEIAFAGRVFVALRALPAEATAYWPNVERVPIGEAEAWLSGWTQRARVLVGPVAGEVKAEVPR